MSNTDIKHVSRKELTADEVLAVIETGGRVVITIPVMGQNVSVVIRRSDGTYYCDTPMKLMKYDNPGELKACLKRFRMVTTESEASDEPSRSVAT